LSSIYLLYPATFFGRKDGSENLIHLIKFNF